jgi:hypothetical protein
MAESMREIKMADKHELASFHERLSAFADDERKKATSLPPGPERDLAFQKIRQAEAAAHLDDWASSPGQSVRGVRSPK